MERHTGRQRLSRPHVVTFGHSAKVRAISGYTASKTGKLSRSHWDSWHRPRNSVMRALFDNGSRGSKRRSLFAGVVALWVCLGIQPCAVAAVSDADCPHCPPELPAPEPEQSSHCGGSAKAADAPHIIAAEECCEADDGAVDGRTASADFKPAYDSAAVLPDPGRLAWTVARLPVTPSRALSLRRCSPLPLHKLHCVYRD